MIRPGIFALLLLSGCSEPPYTPPYEGSGDTAYVMGHVIDPAADVIWGAAGTVITFEGETDLSPTTEAGWLAVEHSAAVISESGNLLMMPLHRRDQADWVEFSVGLSSIGRQLIKASEDRDKDALFKLGGHLYNVCVACHQQYWIKPESD